ncbi:hypothetical protein EVAR_31713_1 [Eumeta japonica]|uniref:Uncharacterized protein n=1 Tax=Eumeta variegata TaxID=151549 RepID=A0A4C1VTX1_EUMVA|nr:hypothetical protein EVAR_31713_1 [Eumeta japonica]
MRRRMNSTRCSARIDSVSFWTTAESLSAPGAEQSEIIKCDTRGPAPKPDRDFVRAHAHRSQGRGPAMCAGRRPRRE